MRDYGKVHTSFWSSDTLYGLSDDAKLLALYLLTCSHGNMAGVFRLPLAYAAEDMGWVAERLRNGFETLSDAGWLRRDEKTGWTWITKFSKWNKADNPNQQKAIDKQVDQVPDSVSFHAELTGKQKGFETVEQPSNNPPISVTVPVPVTAPVPAWLPEQIWSDFRAHRKALKKPMTPLAETRMLANWERLRESGVDVLAAIDTAIRSGWSDVYAPKPTGQPANREPAPMPRLRA